MAICKKEIESLRNTKRITIERIEASKNLIQYACKTNPDLKTCEELRNASSDILKPTPRSQYYTKNSKNTSIFGSFSTNKPKLYLIFVIFGFCIEIAEPLLKNYIELHHSGNRIMLEQATQVYLLIHHSFIIILGLFGLSEWKILLRISTENYSSQVSRITVLVKTIISLELGYRLGWIMKRYQTLGPHDLAQLLLTLMFILSRSDWRGYAVLIFIDYCCAAPECIFRLYFMNQLPSLRTILYIARTILVFWFLIWVGSMGVFSAAFGMFGLGQVVVYSWTFREILYKMGTFRWLFPSFDFSQNAYYSGYGNENTYNTDDRTSY